MFSICRAANEEILAKNCSIVVWKKSPFAVSLHIEHEQTRTQTKRYKLRIDQIQEGYRTSIQLKKLFKESRKMSKHKMDQYKFSLTSNNDGHPYHLYNVPNVYYKRFSSLHSRRFQRDNDNNDWRYHSVNQKVYISHTVMLPIFPKMIKWLPMEIFR